jgi:hypothetical protein
MAAEARTDFHHGAPRCLLGLFDAAATGLTGWSEFDAEAECWGIEIRGLSWCPRTQSKKEAGGRGDHRAATRTDRISARAPGGLDQARAPTSGFIRRRGTGRSPRPRGRLAARHGSPGVPPPQGRLSAAGATPLHTSRRLGPRARTLLVLSVPRGR